MVCLAFAIRRGCNTLDIFLDVLVVVSFSFKARLVFSIHRSCNARNNCRDVLVVVAFAFSAEQLSFEIVVLKWPAGTDNTRLGLMSLQ